VTVSFVGENTAGRHGGGAHGQMGLVSLEGSYFEDNSAVQNGGGLNMNDELTISASSFISNTAGADGGGVLQWNKLKTITLSHTTFSYNTAARTGGGMAAKGELSVDGGLFYKNTAGDAASSQDVYGGGLYLEGGGLSLHGTTFQENKTVCHYCFFSEGGGLAVRNGVSNLVTDAIFQGNSSWFGGGLAQGKLPSDPIYGSLTVLRSTFRNNTGGYGGGLDGINVTVNDSLFEGNSVVNNGGGLEISGDSQLDRVRVLQNRTTAVQSKGAGISITASATILNSVFNENIHQSTNSGAVGPGIFINPNAGAVTLKQVTISHNTGGNGSGLQVDGGSATLANVILTRQVLGVCVKAGSAALDGVLWYSNTSNSGSAPDCPLTPTVSHAVTGDPAFAPDGYHITGGSAAFNAGLVSGVPDDLDGDSRPQFGLYDLGADELVYRVNLPMIKK
jgi:predicted outer membrane repeat protein